MSIPWYHLRVSVNDPDSANFVITEYLKVFPVSAYIFGYEEVGENKHFHGHLQYFPDFDPKLPKNKVKRSDFFKKMKKEEAVPDKSEASYHEEARDVLKNLAYCIKECKILFQCDIDEDFLEQAKNYSEKVEKEKKICMKQLLLDAWKPRNRLFLDKLEAFMFIDSFHVERDYLPPNFTNKIQYALYIVYKLRHLKNHDIQFYKLVSSLNGIRDTDYDLTDIKKMEEIDNETLSSHVEELSLDESVEFVD